jgi:hypothetical protein
MTSRPSAAVRVGVSLLIGIAAGLACFAKISSVRAADDFSLYWLGARALIEGKNPYVVVQAGGAFNLDAPFVYPLTTAMMGVPFALWLSPIWGATIFVALSAAMLAWGITQDGFARLPVFASAPFLWACTSGQLSPLLTAGALLPAVGWLAPVKPNVGMATLAYRPSRWSVAGSLLFVVASLVINPRWPVEWMAALSRFNWAHFGKGVPVTLFGGPLLLLALTRWRRREARLFLILSCVPQTLMFYDQLPLWLIPQTRLRSMSFSLVSLIGLILADAALPDARTYAQVGLVYWPMILATCYLPALAMILREPNTGQVPLWLEQKVSRFGAALGRTSRSVAERELPPFVDRFIRWAWTG